jgi:Mn-dependent DtxR family transcriptional regulator
MKEHTDEECLAIFRYLSSNPDGKTTDLINRGFDSELINSLPMVGFLSISQNGSYKMTEFGKKYAKILLESENKGQNF